MLRVNTQNFEGMNSQSFNLCLGIGRKVWNSLIFKGVSITSIITCSWKGCENTLVTGK